MKKKFTTLNQTSRETLESEHLNQNSETKVSNRWYENINNTTGFLLIVSALLICLLIYLFCAYSTLNKSQQKIIETHRAHTVYIDSTFCKFSRAIENNNTNTKFVISNDLDSVINIIFVKDDTVRSALAEEKIAFINEFFSKIIINQGRANNLEQFSREFKKDSLLMHNEMLFAQQQVQSMLELHLNKVEHEYTNITIWAAILTIIFLVFSFYSMFKIEEARKDIKEILADTAQNAEDIITSIKSRTENLDIAISNFSTKNDLIIKEYRSEIEPLIDQYKEKLKGIDNMQKAAEDILDNMSKKAAADILDRVDKILMEDISARIDKKETDGTNG